MTRTRQIPFRPTTPAHTARPLTNLERVQPVYFFTPDLEREINRLDGVSSSRVLSTGAEIDEIHVIAPRDRTPKKLVRDIESLLLVRFGIRIDHRKISVVQTGAEIATPAALTRPRILKIETSEMGERTVVRVEIGAEGETISGVGEAEGGESPLTAGSRALINAIEKLLHTQGALALHHLSLVQANAQTIVLAVLGWNAQGEEEILVGATLARGAPQEDAARATFDAVNRKLVRTTQPKATHNGVPR